MPDFWRNSGFHLLEKDPAGRLRVTDDFLRAYYLRPEVHPVEESDEAERRLHAALMDEPRRRITQRELEAIGAPDARDHHPAGRAFRVRRRGAESREACSASLFKGTVDTPPLFIEQLVHVILRNILEGCD